MAPPDARFEKAYLKRMRDKIEALASHIGGDAEAIMDDHESCATLMLSERDVEKVLRLCGAKPLPENRRPSEAKAAKDNAEWSRRCDLLNPRLRRAVGCGKSGWRPPNELHQASIYFLLEECLDQAATTLGVGQNPGANLSQLIS